MKHRHKPITLSEDRQLEEFGIFTTESRPPGAEQPVMLTRQLFRDVQVQDFDVYPDDEVFVGTVLSAIELDMGFRLRLSAEKSAAANAQYIYTRRPSQPDFVIDPQKALDVLGWSRYEDNALCWYDSLSMSRFRLMVLRQALARAGAAVMTMEEFEQPLRLSGGVFMSPSWCKEAVAQNPFMLGLADFKRHLYKMRVDERLAHAAFHRIARELLDENHAESPATHEFASEFFADGGSMRYVDSATGLLTLDTPAAYHVVFEKWPRLIQAGGLPPSHESAGYIDAVQKLRQQDNVLKLAQLALSDKIPPQWFKSDGRLVPPTRDNEFEF